VLFEHSAEGDTACLGCIEGEVVRFPREAMHDESGDKLKVPHMGWNNVHQAKGHPLWAGIGDGSRFYYVHSYYVQPAEAGLVAGYSHYPFPFTCAIASGNIFAVQFHPEKSAEAGLRLLGNFISWDPFNSQAVGDTAAPSRA
jgi:glutamine amidotransferase